MEAKKFKGNLYELMCKIPSHEHCHLVYRIAESRNYSEERIINVEIQGDAITVW